MRERHASDLYRTKTSIAIVDPVSEGGSENNCRFLSDKRPPHVFCELKTPDTIPELGNSDPVRPDNAPRFANCKPPNAICAHVRKTSEKIHIQERTRLKTPDTIPNGNPINAVRVPSWSDFDQAEQGCRKESD
jgi:hypothetical protein